MSARRFSCQVLTMSFAALGVSTLAVAQTDPGPRGGPAGAGSEIGGLTVKERKFFNSELDAFAEAEDVADGLGPRFNLDSCGGCHAAPAIGGSSPLTNPQVAIAPPGQYANVSAFIRRILAHRRLK